MSDERQRVVRVAGARRAKLTRVPGTSSEPAAVTADERPEASDDAGGPNDQRMLREVPPHY